jgi:type IV secretory pathway VirB10-like protein
MNRVTLGLLVLVGAASAACASATAKAAPDRPPLEVPAPPSKVIEPPQQPEPDPAPVPDLPPPQPTSSRPPRQPSRETAKPDPKQEAATATDSAPTPAPVSPAPLLRQPGAADPSEAAKQVQAVIDHASKSLESVNTKGFSKARRAVYENARGMLTQAQEALKKSDFDNARKLAGKVEDTARELGGGR